MQNQWEMPPTLADVLRMAGVLVVVTSVKPFEFDGRQRWGVTVKRLKGKNSYHAVLYESGRWSAAVGLSTTIGESGMSVSKELKC